MRLIDADALKDAFHEEWDEVLVWDESGETTADAFCDIVDTAPNIEPKHGRWEKKGISIKGIEKEFCSECKTWSYGRSKAFCPNCGADMREMENGK